MKLRTHYLIAIVLVLAALPAQAQYQSFALTEGPGKLITSMIAAGDGNLDVYHTLVQLQSHGNPSIVGVLTPAFLSTLATCPANSSIFTNTLSAYAGSARREVRHQPRPRRRRSGWPSSAS